MGLYLLGAEAGGQAIGEAASYAALLDLVRSGAADGDIFRYTGNRALLDAYKPTGREGILLPPSWRDALSTGYVPNATGVAEMTIGMDEDTDGDLTASGWTVVTASGGTFSKVGGQAAVLHSGTTNGGSSNPKFFPTSIPASGFLVVCLEWVDPPPNNTSAPMYIPIGGSHYIRFQLTSSAETGLAFLWSGAVQQGGGRINLGVGQARTLFIRYASASDDSNVSVWCLETGEAIAAQRDQIIAAGTTATSFVAYNSGGTAVNQTVLKVSEWHWLT